jgi:hypothetical protein
MITGIFLGFLLGMLTFTIISICEDFDEYISVCFKINKDQAFDFWSKIDEYTNCKTNKKKLELETFISAFLDSRENIELFNKIKKNEEICFSKYDYMNPKIYFIVKKKKIKKIYKELGIKFNKSNTNLNIN